MSNQMIIERAKSAEMAHDFATAVRLYKELLSQDNTNVQYLAAIGKIYVTAGEDKKAIPYFEQIHSFHPDNIEAITSLGAIYRRLGRYEESIRILQKALESGKDLLNVYYNLGFTYKEMKDYEDAVDAFENVISMNPRDVLTHNHLGSIYLETNELDKAVAAYKRGLQIDPNHPILHYNLARTYTKLKDYSEAIRSYEAALKTRPNWPEAIRNFSNLLINCQQSEEAARIVKQSIKIHPNDPELLYSLGQVYLNQFDYDNAQKSFKQAKEIKENDVKILTALSSAYEKADESDKALETILSAIELEPKNQDVRMQYVDALLSVSDYDSAFETLEAMDGEEKEKNVKVMDLYGQYYITQGENDKAEEVYDQIKKKDHHYKSYLLGASKRFAQIEKYDDAEKYAKEYVKSRSSRGEGYNMLGKIYEKNGRLDEAREILKKGSSVASPNIFAVKHIEKIISMQKELTEESGVEEIPAEEITEQPQIEENENIAIPEAEDDFDVYSFGDDVGAEAESEADEISSIDDEIEDDDEALIVPEEDEELSASELLDAIGTVDSMEPENTLKPEESDNFADSFGEAEEVPLTEDGALPSEPEVEPVPVEAVPSAAPVYPAPAYVPPAPAAQPSAFELEALLSATKTAQEAMRLAQNAEKRVDEMEERQKLLEEELENGGAAGAEEVPPAVAEDALTEEAAPAEPEEAFSDEDKAAGAGAALPDEDETAGFEEALSDENLPPSDEELFAADEILDEATFGGDTESVEDSEDLPEAEDLSFEDEMYSDDNFITVDDVFPAGESTNDSAASDFEANFAAEMETNLSTSLFVTVDELYSEMLSKIGDIDDTDAAEKLSELAEKIEDGEINPVEMQDAGQNASDFKAPEEAPAVGGEKSKKLSEVAQMLKKIEAILSDDDLALKYTKEISLLKHLKVLCEYLPDDEKISFASGRIRMLIDYLLSKMSGRPGLLLTTQSLLKSGVLGEEYRVQLISDCEAELNNEMIRRVLVYMKKLSESLEDFGLSAALRACADGALEKIEIENQKSQIF
ncbi:MAG: tetratricopeptide repeat protein [Treponema sp.]|nr:tetratricopeptide repeat protein [Treponema sp.]